MAKKLVSDKQRATYLAADSEHYAELQMWISQQPPGIHQELIGTLHFQLAQSVRNNQPQLTKDLATAINALTKSALQHSLLMGELWCPEQRRQFESDLTKALMEVLQKECPDSWQDVMNDIADRFQEIATRCTQLAAAEAPKKITLR